jgi:hypothetical protein
MEREYCISVANNIILSFCYKINIQSNQPQTVIPLRWPKLLSERADERKRYLNPSIMHAYTVLFSIGVNPSGNRTLCDILY